MITVMNLQTGKQYVYSVVCPKAALKLAHMQIVQKNFNTWTYDNITIPEIKESTRCYNIGSLTAFKTAFIQIKAQGR